jgi:hypothetical protein
MVALTFHLISQALYKSGGTSNPQFRSPHFTLRSLRRGFIMQWLLNNSGTIIVGLIVAAVVAAIIIGYIRKKKKGQPTCGCGCADCPMKGKDGACGTTRK